MPIADTFMSVARPQPSLLAVGCLALITACAGGNDSGLTDPAAPEINVDAAAAESGDVADPITDDPEVQAAVDAFALVFDSTADWEAKAPHLEDAGVLQEPNESFRQAGSVLGGIKLEPTAAAIAGDTVTVTYDVFFGPIAAFDGLTRTITLVDGRWTVSRSDFCDVLSSAGTRCPD